MTARRINRRNRRMRKWYRAERSLNRASSKRSGRLPPSIKTNAEEVIRVVSQNPLPISRIVIEDVQVDLLVSLPHIQGQPISGPNPAR